MTDGVCGEGLLPLSWRILDRPASGAETARANEYNESLLKAVAVLDEPPLYREEPSGDIEQGLSRIDAKLDFILGLLGDVLMRESGFPAAMPVRYSAEWLRWRPGGETLPVGAELSVDLYVNPRIPRPLRLFGRVAERDDAGNVTVYLEAMSPAVREALDRLVFRHHRRAVAQRRQGGASG